MRSSLRKTDAALLINVNSPPARAPGSQTETEGTADDILRDVDTVLSAPRWMGADQIEQKNESDMRRQARLDLCHHTRCDENGLARLMSRLITHMGANIRAYHFLCFQKRLGLRENEPIALAEVKELTPMIVEQGWLKAAPRETYEKYLKGGNLHLLTEDFRGKGN